MGGIAAAVQDVPAFGLWQGGMQIEFRAASPCRLGEKELQNQKAESLPASFPTKPHTSTTGSTQACWSTSHDKLGWCLPSNSRVHHLESSTLEVRSEYPKHISTFSYLNVALVMTTLNLAAWQTK